MDCAGNCFMSNCMDSYCQSPWPDLGAVDGVVDDRAHPLPMDFVQRRQERQPRMHGKQHVRTLSSSSCNSSRSLMSSDTASSAKSHRRCNIEVSSVLFGSGSSPERTTEQDCTYQNTFPVAIMQQHHSPSSDHLKVKPKSVSTIESTGMEGIRDGVAKRSSGESKNQINILDSAGAIELIRQLSFDSNVPPRPTTPHSENHRSSFRIEPRDGGERPPVSPTSPPLPRKNIRFGFSQIMRNHYRARSTSITDASESHLSESALDTEEMSMTSLSHSTTSSEDNEDNEESSRKAFDMKPLIAIEYNVSSTQKLAPRPSPLLGHVRSRSMCSESSYISSSDEDDDFYGGGPDHYLLEEDLD